MSHQYIQDEQQNFKTASRCVCVHADKTNISATSERGTECESGSAWWITSKLTLILLFLLLLQVVTMETELLTSADAKEYEPHTLRK